MLEMMRGMKDDEKGLSPMFPRVHANDAESGCQRAPPRNKMALYEQLSIPSQRFSYGSAPLFPLPPSNGSNIVPSTSSTHIGGRRRVVLTSFYKPPMSTHGAEKLTSYSSTLVKSNDMANEETKAPVSRITKPSSSDYKSNKIEDKKTSSKNQIRSEEDKNCDSIHPKHSITSKMNSTSANIISPDDIVRVLGEKQFWDTRKTIINQQRIFALQLFELQRIIKVQRLIAESPHLLLENNLYSKKSAMKVPKPKKPPTESARNPISPRPCNNEVLKRLVTIQSKYDFHSRNTRQASPSTNTKLEPWCFPTIQASPWLVPVMSPSEGLIYKPMTGICPPNAGFFNAAYGVPLNHQSLSCSAVDQASPWTKTRSKGPDIQASAGEINQHSHNMSSQTSPVMTREAEKGRGLKGSELQGSTASSAVLWPNGDLPLVSMAPKVEESDQNRETSENKSRVIKVVPHNPRTATESAARILKLIQEERNQI